MFHCLGGVAHAAVASPTTAPEPAVSSHNSAVSAAVVSPTIDRDLWSEMRTRFQLTVADRGPIEQQARAIASSQAGVQINLQHASRYMFYILQEVAARDMPSEMALIPFLESGFNPKSKSGLQPAGLWGLMPIASKSLNLSANFFSDDRRDILLSTQAALNLLQTLYAQFGDWRLALIAYNWGPGNVVSVLRRQQALKLPLDYDHLHFPKVIQAYVSKLMAWRELIADPERYKVSLPLLAYQPYFVEVAATHNIDINIAADLAEISVADFLYLNPSFNKPLIRGTADHKILLPVTQVDVFLTNYLTHQERFSAWQTLIVSQAQRPEDLAKTHNVSVGKLYEMNPLARGAQIRAGSSIFIPEPIKK
ncbi:MAG: transglycosylase SLT domain-containing protein [Alcaligenaceae bacterium]